MKRRYAITWATGANLRAGTYATIRDALAVVASVVAHPTVRATVCRTREQADGAFYVYTSPAMRRRCPDHAIATIELVGEYHHG